MPDRLVDDPDGVAVLAASVADATGIPAAHVEKDFWVTEVLRGVVDAAGALGVEIVFKGGTSLSKAFGLIERFSEDVDVLVVLSPQDSTGARDRTLKALVDGATRATGLDAATVPAATTKGAKRGARFGYRTNVAAAGLSDGVFLELGSRGGGMPATPLLVSSLIARHASVRIAGAVEVDPVLVRVQAPWRTLVEKLVLLHTAHSDDEPTAAISGARHYYDVHQLVTRREIIAGIHEHGVAILARDVCTYSRAAEMPAADPAAGSPSAQRSPTAPTSPPLTTSTNVVCSASWCGPMPPTPPSRTASRRSPAPPGTSKPHEPAGLAPSGDPAERHSCQRLISTSRDRSAPRTWPRMSAAGWRSRARSTTTRRSSATSSRSLGRPTASLESMIASMLATSVGKPPTRRRTAPTRRSS